MFTNNHVVTHILPFAEKEGGNFRLSIGFNLSECSFVAESRYWLNPDCPLECLCKERRPGANADVNRGEGAAPTAVFWL